MNYLYSANVRLAEFLYTPMYYVLLPANFIMLPIYNSIATYSLFESIVGRNSVIINTGIPLLISTAAGLAIYSIDTYIGSGNDSLFINYLSLNSYDINKDEQWKQFNVFILNFISFSILSELIKTIERYISDKLTLSLAREAEDATDKKVYSNQNLIKISSQSDNKNDYPNISYSCILILSRTGSYLTKGASTVIQASIGAFMLFQLHPILPILSIIYGGVTQIVGKLISKKIAELETLVTDNVNRRQKPLKQHSINESVKLVTSGAEKLNLKYLTETKSEERSLKNKKIILEKLLSFVNNTASVLNVGIRWYVSGLMFYKEIIKPGDRAIIEIGMLKINQSFSYILEIAPELANTMGHIKKVRAFQDKLKDLSNLKDDKIIKSYEEGVFKIKQLAMFKDKKLLFQVDKLECKTGDRCVIYGSTGCGKSTFFAKIKSLNITQNYIAEGYITYPDKNKEKNIILVSQEDYIPFEQSIYQFIYLPEILPKKLVELKLLKAQINDLLQEAEIFEELRYRLEPEINSSRDNIDQVNSLSGGQKKILKLIGAIVHKPSVLILDETIKSLDPGSKGRIYQMLDTYLRDTIIISSYHKDRAESKRDKFYNIECFIKNGFSAEIKYYSKKNKDIQEISL
ncbi:ATP-binding cassette domain-containing protein [Candidatus Jidaibacter acanthamoebae]|nr:ATP-binding cassette domain-containing protein [Candidatus Jidaibacter acanthamoeba]